MCFEGSFFLVYSSDCRSETMDMIKLRGAVQEYIWGDTTFISSLLGQIPDARTRAELWMGVHPNGMSTLLETDEPLDRFIDSHREEILGTRHEERFHDRFPFLMKVLAIAEPLSLQVHPDAARAVKMFALEQERTDGVKNYTDPYQKDEVLVALDEVTALAGFRELEESLSFLEEIVGEYFAVMASSENIEQLFRTLISLSEEERKACISALSDYVQQEWQYIDSPFLSARQIARKLLSLYPDDIMVFAPFLLKLIHLRPGEALHVRPGMLHSYVSGHAVEIMSSSDNVLRAGLTPKHVDVEELLEIVSFEPFDGKKTPLRRISGTDAFLDVKSSEFSLRISESGEARVTDREYVEIALVTEGSGRYQWGEQDLRVMKGDIILIPASIPSYTLTLEGSIVTASVGAEEEV